MKEISESPILRNTFHHSRFSDKQRLVDLKVKQGFTISLGFPTLNEEATIGKEILILKTELMDRFPLLDELVVIDSGSQDKTRAIAESFGAKVYVSKDILPRYGSYRGKGENLWKSLYILSGDIIVWIDADIHNISPKFVYGLLGPLLENPELSYVKAFYERPIKTPSEFFPSGGGEGYGSSGASSVFSFFSGSSLFGSAFKRGICGKKEPVREIAFLRGLRRGARSPG